MSSSSHEVKESAKETVIRLHKSMTFRYRAFAIGFIVAVGVTAAFGYTIHPGLGGLIVSAYAVYFCRVNLTSADEQRYRLEQAIYQAQATILSKQAEPTVHKGNYL